MPEDIRLFNADCLTVLPTLAAGSVDAVVTDPPYNLAQIGRSLQLTQNGDGTDRTHQRNHRERGFMGCAWDGGIAFRPETWQAALRALKPGGYLLAFGGTRTFHRLACALEDAGFEMRDTLMWLYGSGFPKGKGCLKPAWEPVLLCRRPGPRVLPLGVDECRVGTTKDTPASLPKGDALKGWGERPGRRGKSLEDDAFNPNLGRYPANVCHDGSPEVLEAFAAFGPTSTTGKRSGRSRAATVNGTAWGPDNHKSTEYANEPPGTAARFFYAAKASRRERNAGLEGMPEAARNGEDYRRRVNTSKKSEDGVRGDIPRANTHPCVKPLALMRWLVKLACPAGGVVLDPFMGSGTTGVACVQTGRRGIGVELDKGYFAIAQKRIAAARDAHPLFAEAL